MVSRTRIRWTGVAKLAAGAVGCGALALALPALLEPPKPPPLPADVGFTPDPGGVGEGSLRATSVQLEHRHPKEDESKPRPAHHDGNDAHPRGRQDPKAHRQAKPTEPAPTPVATPPAPTPAPPAAAVPSPPTVAPAPPPPAVQAAAPPAPEEPPAPPPEEPSDPSEFGFEH